MTTPLRPLELPAPPAPRSSPRSISSLSSWRATLVGLRKESRRWKALIALTSSLSSGGASKPPAND